MRKSVTTDQLTVKAIAGSHVVLLGFSLPEPATSGLLGFAIEREDHTEHEKHWLQGMRTFEATDPGLAAGALMSTRDHPIQDFRWSDFTAKPAHDYTYRVVALGGTPEHLTELRSAEVRVGTESEDEGTHAVFFNRGVAGSQAYARKFKNESPDKVPAAYAWLSRGLVEALRGFIGQANGAEWKLRAAMYEFDEPSVLAAFADAAKAGADVEIIVDAKVNASPPKTPHSDPRDRNMAAIDAAGLKNVVTARESNPSYIAHNKFIVLLRGENPVQIWTGSTNVTRGGIYGHSNVGHIVRDPAVAAKYLAYWERLQSDPQAAQLRPLNEEADPTPNGTAALGTTVISSPRGSLGALEWYRDCMQQAKEGVFFTAAFGVNDLFEAVLEEDVPFLRYVLLDNASGDTAQTVQLIKRDADNRVAVGEVMEEGALKSWLGEQLAKDANGRPFNVHVKYLHTKYMLIDPLSDDPLVITGSANFSNASTRNNDENMLVIRGDTRVADIYLGEFMRLFTHFAFRDFAGSHPGVAKRYLSSTDAWAGFSYRENSVLQKERRLFSGATD